MNRKRRCIWLVVRVVRCGRMAPVFGQILLEASEESKIDPLAIEMKREKSEESDDLDVKVSSVEGRNGGRRIPGVSRCKVITFGSHWPSSKMLHSWLRASFSFYRFCYLAVKQMLRAYGIRFYVSRKGY